MKIAIIAFFFPPQTSIASLRPYSWAKYWARNGHDVTVFTVPKHHKITTDSPLPFDGFKVSEIEVPFLVTAKKIIRQFKKKGGQGATPGFNKDKNKNTLRGWLHTHGIASACRMPEPIDIWALRLKYILKRTSWDVIVSTAGPYSTHIPAYSVTLNQKAKIWVADWRDLWVDNHIFPGVKPFTFIEGLLEKKWCLRADVVTTVSPPLADILANKYDRRVEVIYNGYDEEELEGLPKAPMFAKGGERRILYTGTIYEKFQDPSPLFKAIHELWKERQINPQELKVIFMGNCDSVKENAVTFGIESFVVINDMVPRTDALRAQRDADAQLLLEWDNHEIKGILTGKLFEYLRAGPPVMAIGPDKNSDVGKLLEETGSGIAFGKDVGQLKKALTSLVKTGRLSGDSSITRDEERIKFYSRETQAIRMLNIIQHTYERKIART